MALGAYTSAVVTKGIVIPRLPYPSTASLFVLEHGATMPPGKLFLDSLAWLLSAVGGILAFAVNLLGALLGTLTDAAHALPDPLQFPAGLFLGGLVAAAFGLLVGIPSLRLKGDYLAIVTLGFAEICRVLIQNAEFVEGPRGIAGIPGKTTVAWAFAVACVATYVVCALVNSTHGRGFLAVRDDEVAAGAMGINTTKYKVFAFVIGAFLAGVAGGLYAHHLCYINPSNFDFMLSVSIVVMVILGGMGNTPGVIAAAVVLKVSEELLRAFAKSEALESATRTLFGALPPDGVQTAVQKARALFENRMIFFSLLLIALMLLRPQGLFGRARLGRAEKLPAGDAGSATKGGAK
jgi:branched-chain amino acid transport system permease protein